METCTSIKQIEVGILPETLTIPRARPIMEQAKDITAATIESHHML